MSDERATVFYCPFCGEEDLRPAEAHLADFPRAWACGSCRRAFTVRTLGPAAQPVPLATSSPSEQEAAL